MEHGQNIVGAFEAKTRLSELLRKVDLGFSFLICRRGKAVARLIPAPESALRADMAALAPALREIRSGISGKLDVVGLVREGRR